MSGISINNPEGIIINNAINRNEIKLNKNSYLGVLVVSISLKNLSNLKYTSPLKYERSTFKFLIHSGIYGFLKPNINCIDKKIHKNPPIIVEVPKPYEGEGIDVGKEIIRNKAKKPSLPNVSIISPTVKSSMSFSTNLCIFFSNCWHI